MHVACRGRHAAWCTYIILLLTIFSYDQEADGKALGFISVNTTCLDGGNCPWESKVSSGPKEMAYEISWAKLRDDAGMRMQDAEALVLRALRLVHDSPEFGGKKPPSDNPKVVAFIYTNNARSIAVAKKLGYEPGSIFPTTRKPTCKSATSYVKSLPPSSPGPTRRRERNGLRSRSRVRDTM